MVSFFGIPQSEAMKAGQAIGKRYVLVDALGEGAMGEVWKAYDRADGSLAALKFLRAELARDPKKLNRFFAEASNLSQLGSEHIVAFKEFSQSAGGEPFLAMEFVEGTDLYRLVKRHGPLVPARAVDLVLQVCQALGLAHGLRPPVIHRDLKPENITLIDRDDKEQVKLLDFGVAKRVGVHLSVAGTLVGTPVYMAPEQIPGGSGDPQAVDSRMDLYAAGGVLFTLLTGEWPCAPPEMPAMIAGGAAWKEFYDGLRDCKRTGPRFPSDLSLPFGLSEVVRQALAFDPDQRYSTAQELEKALRPFASQPLPPTLVVPPQVEELAELRRANEQAEQRVFELEREVGEVRTELDQARQQVGVVQKTLSQWEKWGQEAQRTINRLQQELEIHQQIASQALVADAAGEEEEAGKLEVDSNRALISEDEPVPDIWEQFKQGVSSVVDEDAADTHYAADNHYDLGVAYKEMGLIEDAVAEFELAREDPDREVLAETRIGDCYSQVGQYTDAIDAYKRGLYSERKSDAELQELLYSLGTSYLELSNPQEALYYFKKVDIREVDYRDVKRLIAAIESGEPNKNN